MSTAKKEWDRNRRQMTKGNANIKNEYERN